MRRDAPVDTIRWFEVEPCFVFHPMNAWEDGDILYADVMEYSTPPLFPNLDGSLNRPSGARLSRWTIDLAGDGTLVKREPLDDRPGDFPRFDERRAGLAYRHGWFAASGARAGGVGADIIAHVDHANGGRQGFALDAGDATGEPIFVPRHPGADEGDGWVLSVVYRGEADTSEFLVFDAQDVAAGPIAAARLPRRVPFGFHGNWRPAG